MFFRNFKGVIVRFAQDIVEGRRVQGALFSSEFLNKMIPSSDSAVAKGHVLRPPKMSAHEYHKAILSLLLHKGSQLTEAITEEQIRLLREYAYRGCDIRYKSSNE